MEGVLETVRALSEEIGPRPAGSEAERKASRWVAERFRALGLTPWIQEFRGATDVARPFGLIYAAGALGGLLMLATPLPRPGALLALAACAVLFLEARRSEVVGRSIRMAPGQNVLTQVSAAGAPARRAFILARLDSGARPTVWRRLRARWGVLASRLLFLPLLALGACGLVILPFPAALGALGAALLPAFALSGAATAGLLLAERTARPSPGVLESAAVAALLELAERCKAAPLANTELWFCATGSGHAGMIGTARMIEHYPKETEGAYFLALDRVGGGDLRYVRGEEFLLTVRADAEMLAFAEAVAAERPELGLAASRDGLPATDAFVPLIRGRKALALTGVGADGSPVGEGGPAGAAVDPAAALRAVEAARAILEKIDAKPL